MFQYGGKTQNKKFYRFSFLQTQNMKFFNSQRNTEMYKKKDVIHSSSSPAGGAMKP